MATTRAAIIAGAAALAVLCAAIPSHAQSRSAGAPLQLLPGTDQATRAGRPAARAAARSSSRKSVRKAIKAAAKPHARRVARPATRQPTQKNTRTATTASPRANGPRSRTAVQNRAAQRAIVAAVPEVRRQETEPLAFAPMPAQQAVRTGTPSAQPSRQAPATRNAVTPDAVTPDAVTPDNVMRDGNSVSLVGRLPWWRNNPLQPIRYGSPEVESQVMAAADAWLVAHGTPDAQPVLAGASEDDRIVIADAGDFNAVDRAFASVPAPRPPTYWHSLIAILSGAAAAALAALALARFLFIGRPVRLME